MDQSSTFFTTHTFRPARFRSTATTGDATNETLRHHYTEWSVCFGRSTLVLQLDHLLRASPGSDEQLVYRRELADQPARARPRFRSHGGARFESCGAVSEE